jgi:hypothetical protein
LLRSADFFLLIRQILGGQGASHLRLEALEALEAYPTIELSLAGWEAYPTVEHWIALADGAMCLESSLF